MPSFSGRSRRKADRRRHRTFAAELLEPRQLLAGLTTDVKSPIEATLIRLATDAAPGGQGPLDVPAIIAAAQAASVNVNAFGELGVTITGTDTAALLPGLQASGLTVTANLPSHHLVEGYLAVTSLESLLDLRNAGLLGVRASYAPITRTGAVADQADVVHESNRVRDALPTGYDGTGIKIGVLSDSYNSLNTAAADVTGGDLPGNVQVLEDSGTTDEGRAMLQLIHDIAPGASLAFATANGGEANFAGNIRDLATAGSNIIVDDVIYFAEPMFQDGIIAQAVDDVVAGGTAFFSAAGNDADQSYESTNVDFVLDPLGFGPFGITKCYDFDPSVLEDTRQSITVPNGQSATISFQWDDPFYTAGGVDTDLDIFIVREDTNTVVASSFAQNVIDQTPGEVLNFFNNTGTTDFEIIINYVQGPFPERLKYVEFRGQMSVDEYDTHSSTIYGHTAAAGGIAVAAAPYFDQAQAESFSSHGRTRILFNPDGTPLAAAEVRNTPQITAIDGTNTTFFGSDLEGDGPPNFFGTSAAAPHAAAIAALIKQANPSFTPQQIYQRMQDTAIDLGAPGWDKVTGAGLVNAYDAVFGPAQAALLPFADSFEPDPGNLTKPVFLSQAWETNSTGAGRMTLNNVNGPTPPGVQHLVMDTFFGPRFGLNEAILHLNMDNYTGITLSFEEKETTDVDDLMPVTFTGSVNADGVALSVDGVNWYRLFDLTDTGTPPSTANYQTFSADLEAFAAANLLTLGADVRIKFQQYGDSNATNRGIFFDNIDVTGTVANTPPTAVDDSLPGSPEDTPYVIAGSSLTGNDTDPESDNLSVIAVANAVKGTVSVSGGVVTFIPNPDYNGPASFDYTVTDDHGVGSDVGSVTFNVTPVNDAPIAVDDAPTGATQDTSFLIPEGNLTANDTDVDVDALTVTAVGNAVHGTVSLASGVVTFAPFPGYDGPASFEYTVSDGVDTDIGLVTFDIAGNNDAPAAISASVATNEDTALSGGLTSSDPEGDSVTYILTAIPSHGLITSFNASTGAYIYTPRANYNGPDSFAFKVNDGALDSASATISITVNSVNDAPILYPSAPQLVPAQQGATDPPGTLINDFLSGRVTDADGSLMRGIAITFVTGTTSGKWQFKYDALSWTNLPAVSQAAALLLPGRAQIRFVPGVASFTGQVKLNYRAWDQTQGALGGTFDISNKATSIGGSTAFSTAFDVATLKVDKPPVLTQPNTTPVVYKLNSKVGVNFMIDASFNKTKLTDFDSPDFDSGVLRIHTSVGQSIGDRIIVGWNFSFQGTNVVYQGLHIGDVLSDGIDGNDLEIRLNSAATLKVTEQLINSLQFKTVAGLKGTRTLQVNVSDGDGGTSNTLTRQVVVN